ncbi:condensation domain-containing protein [Streptomyces arenae]|uniref:condensation domain-containing protein n=1 Tax=Streptomyces arenae TaxID=29301 RepID=UPI00265948E2|nr:condensation domain-containing protein [Streptomyces arenae]MCG7204956.1 condensation domain-containing protein [Streptomyces arenae]
MTEDLAARLASLTPEQRRVLALRARERRGPGRTVTEGRGSAEAPLSHAQERLWFLDSLDPGDPAYNITFGVRLTGPLDRAALERALTAVITRHPALCTVVTDHPEGVRQTVRPPSPVDLPLTDLRTAADPAAELAAVTAGHARHRFDLRTGPPLAARLVRRAAEDHLLLVAVHHIVFDGWSSELLLRDLVACYGHAAGGAEPPPEPVVRFTDHAARERDTVTDAYLDRDLSFWREELAGAPALSTLPSDLPRPTVQSHRGGWRAVTVPADLTERLDGLARRERTTVNVVVLAAMSAVLHHAGAPADLQLGVPVAGRQRTDLETVVGCFANTLVVRNRLETDLSVRDLIHGTHRSLRAAYAHQAAPYARVVEAVAPVRAPGHNPLFQVMISVNELTGDTERHAGGVEFVPEELELGRTDFDVFLALRREGGELCGTLTYSADLYLDDTIDVLVRSLITTLEHFAAAPDLPLAEVPSLRRHHLAEAASFTIDPVHDVIGFWSGFLGFPIDVQAAPYSQLLQHLLSGDPCHATVGYLRWADWLRHWEGKDRAAFLTDVLDAVVTAVRTFRNRTPVPLLLVICPAAPGDAELDALYGRLDDLLVRRTRGVPGTDIVFATEWAARSGIGDPYDPGADELGHVPYTPEFYAALGTGVVRRLDRMWATDVWPRSGERSAFMADWLADAAAVAERVAQTGDGRGPDTGPAIAPRTGTERRLAELWAEALGVDEIGVTSDFFAWGGHSLLATRLVSRIRTELSVALSLHEFLAHPTIEALAHLLDGHRQSTDAPRLRPIPREGVLPLSSTQRRMWTLAQLAEREATHNTVYAVTLTGPLDVPALRRALAVVTDRHEILRSTFITDDGVPQVRIHQDTAPWLPDTDLCDRPGSERTEVVRELVREELATPFDLGEGPLLRARLLRAGDDVHHLLIGMHHAVCDGESWNLFLGELAEAYGALSTGSEPRLPALDVQYVDFAAWQQSWLQGEEALRQTDFWRRTLDEAPAVLQLREARPRPRQWSGRAANVSLPVDPQAAQALRSVGRREGVSPFNVLLAALAVAVNRAGGGEDLVIGVPSRGRAEPELDHVIGYFADLLPLRLDLSGRPAFARLLRRVRQTTTEATAMQGIPFTGILDAVRPARDPGHHPLFQWVLNYVERLEPEPVLPGLVTEHLPAHDTSIDFDVFLNASWEGDRLVLDADYAVDVFAPGTVLEMLRSIESVLLTVRQEPDALLTEVPEGGDTPVARLATATTFPGGHLGEHGSEWQRALGIPVRVSPAPVGSVIRPLMDEESAFCADEADLGVVVLRTEDLLPPSVAPSDGRRAALWHVDEALWDLTAALRDFRARRGLPLLLVLSPASAPWDGLEDVFNALGDRLTAAVSGLADVEVAVMDAQGGTAAVARHVLRRLPHSCGYSPRWVALDGAAFDQLLLLRTAAGQLAYARRVLIAPAGEPLPGADALTDVTFLGDLTEDLSRLVADGELTASEGLVLTGDPEAARRRLPGVMVLSADPAREDADCWPLDAPLGAPGHRPLSELTPPGTDRPESRTAVAVDEAAAAVAEQLTQIWQDLLHVPAVDPRDNFYELGGDSMLAIELAYRAVEAGFDLSPRTVVDHPTVAELAALLSEGGGGTVERTDEADEVAALGAGQHWFMAEVAPGMAHPAHFNHPYYLQLTGPADPQRVRAAVDALAAAHDSLRLGLYRDQQGRWCLRRGPEQDGLPFESVDVSGLPAAERDRTVEALAARAQASLELDGRLSRVLHLRMGSGGDRILMVNHHLVTDGVSRGILLEDLRRLLRDGPDRAVGVTGTTPYLSWVRAFDAYAQSPELRAELPFWRAQHSSGPGIPMDLPGRMTFGTLRHQGFHLTEDETRGLLERARAMRLKVNDLLVWAVAGFVGDWTGRQDCVLAMTGHGRDDLTDGMDLSRTTGWFQVFYPLRLTLPEHRDDVSAAADLARQLARVPGSGMGWSALRYGCADPEARAALAGLPLPRVSFNYMGHFNFEESRQGADVFRLCHEPYGLEQDPDGVAPFDLDFVASMTGSRLRIDVNYGLHCHEPATVEWILAELRGRLRRAAEPSRRPISEGNR